MTTDEFMDADPSLQLVPGVSRSELEAVNRVVNLLQSLSKESQKRVLRTVGAFLEIDAQGMRGLQREDSRQSARPHEPSTFSEDRTMSPKAFMLLKKPTTDVERVATLAYYLTHYRDMPSFKTIDLSQLNTEAAQIKFSNPAFSVGNATKLGFLIPAAHGAKQLSAGGELFVQALPDREKAREAMKQFPTRHRSKKGRSNTSRAGASGFQGGKDNEE
jgi:hypothetical protein